MFGFAARFAAKTPWPGRNGYPRPPAFMLRSRAMVMFVERAAVVGAGVMGARIAEVLALNNVNVTLKDVDQAALDRGLATINRDLDELIAFHAGKAEKAI